VENTKLCLPGLLFIPNKLFRPGRANAALFDSGTRGGELERFYLAAFLRRSPFKHFAQGASQTGGRNSASSEPAVSGLIVNSGHPSVYCPKATHRYRRWIALRDALRPSVPENGKTATG
jgi:hypothetical protein